jgi:hypothetical protein
MKRISLLVPIILVVLLSAGCGWPGIRGNGKQQTESRSVSEFTRINAGGFYEINWHSGPPALSVTTDGNLLSHITTSMKGDVLKIEIQGHIAPTEGIKITASSQSLKGAELRGAVELEATPLSGETFALETTGAAKVGLTGKVKRLLASLSGASKLRASDLNAETVEVSVTGAGKADVCASELLRAAITGAGEVSYSCHPKSVEKKITGAGKISARD